LKLFSPYSYHYGRRSFNRCIFLLLAFSTVLPISAQEPAAEEPTKNWFPLPLIFWTPETRIGGGVSVTYVVKQAGDSIRTPTAWTATAIYTQRQQISTILAGRQYIDRGQRIYSGQAFYSRFPNFFFGVGNSTVDTSDTYTPEEVGFAATALFQVKRGLHVGPTVEIDHQKLIKAERNGLLARRAVRGSAAHTNAGIGVSAQWDDRDDQIFPTRGRFHQASTAYFPEWFGTDYPFLRTILDARRYFFLPTEGVLAAQLFGQLTAGRPAFQKMAKVGGASVMRGYFEGRYRDRQMIAAQVEWRQLVWWRLGFNLFAGIGDVAHDPADYRLNEFKYSLGYGIRFLVKSDTQLYMRIEMAYGKDSFYPVLGLGEAF
jgi:outer membrane protein assembly factor BamA